MNLLSIFIALGATFLAVFVCWLIYGPVKLALALKQTCKRGKACKEADAC